MDEAMSVLNKNLTYLEFSEDVRPPFCGSFTKRVSEEELNKVKRRPCSIKVDVLNYDYDSEAEWEEPEEGEDIIGDDDDDDSDEGDDDMDGFIDDDGNAALAARRPAYVRDLPPISSGLQWQDSKGVLCADNTSSPPVDWTELELCFLLGLFLRLRSST
jgi:chromatin assembly factor 1 subunit A